MHFVVTKSKDNSILIPRNWTHKRVSDFRNYLALVSSRRSIPTFLNTGKASMLGLANCICILPHMKMLLNKISIILTFLLSRVQRWIFCILVEQSLKLLHKVAKLFGLFMNKLFWFYTTIYPRSDQRGLSLWTNIYVNFDLVTFSPPYFLWR